MALKRKTPDAPLALNLTHVRGDGNGIFQLNLPSMQGIYCLEVHTYETKRSLTFACNIPISLERPEEDSSPYLFPTLDLIDALRSGLLELVEQRTQKVVQLPPAAYSPSVGHVDIAPHPRPGHTQAIIFIVFNTTAKIWKGILHPYKKYNLRLSATGGAAWCYQVSLPDRRDTMEPDKADRMDLCGSRRFDRNSSSESSTASSLEDDHPVRRDPGIIHFTVYNDPVPPTCSAVFSLGSPVCHRSGTPQFKFITEITLDASDAAYGPVTVGLYDEPFNVDAMGAASEYIRFVDTTTGEEVYFAHAHPCWGEIIPTPPDFPTDDWFVELWPGGKSWRHEYTLERTNNDYSNHGGLGRLEVGKKYTAELSSNLKSGFAMWMHGRKEDLLRGTAEEKRERWAPGPRGRPAISIRQLNKPVQFDVVD